MRGVRSPDSCRNLDRFARTTSCKGGAGEWDIKQQSTVLSSILCGALSEQIRANRNDSKALRLSIARLAACSKKRSKRRRQPQNGDRPIKKFPIRRKEKARWEGSHSFSKCYRTSRITSEVALALGRFRVQGGRAGDAPARSRSRVRLSDKMSQARRRKGHDEHVENRSRTRSGAAWKRTLANRSSFRRPITSCRALIRLVGAQGSARNRRTEDVRHFRGLTRVVPFVRIAPSLVVVVAAPIVPR